MSQCVSLRAVTVACYMTSMEREAFLDLFLVRVGGQLRLFSLERCGGFAPNVVACFKRQAESCPALRVLSIVSRSARSFAMHALGDSLIDMQTTSFLVLYSENLLCMRVA